MNDMVLISCGIFQKEITMLIEKHQWPVEPFFLPSTLHIHFEKLADVLEEAMQKFSGRPIVLCYGACHPLIDDMLEAHQAIRTPGQNCVELLLGKERFTQELSQGAFFLFEDWALKWDREIGKALGGPENVKLIFQSEHRSLLGVTTCCSGNFTRQAEEVSHMIGLPLQWMPVELDHLERILAETISQMEQRE